MDTAPVKILVVEDNPADADLVRAMLAGAGASAFDIECVESLSGALSRLEQAEFGVVLLDLTLPDAVGLDTLRRAQLAAPSTSIVVLSGLEDEELAIRAVQEGAQDFLFKNDVNPNLLARVIRHSIERHRFERSLLEKEEQLRQAQKMEAVGSLAGGIAHEFNNLLQVIGGYTRFAAEGLPSDDPRYLDLKEALEATDRAAVLTRQLLTFTRQEPMQRGDVELNEVVGELAKMVRPLIGERIELRVTLDEELETVRGDAAMLRQALLNLCVNARDAMPSGGELAIRTESTRISDTCSTLHPAAGPGRYARIVVSDTGCGMTQEMADRAFEPFFTTKRPGKGTGLGLAMVYGVVQQHGGTINVHSEPGMGTTIEIYLPIGETTTPNDEPPANEEPCRKTETILIAEDEELVRKLAVRILQRAGYRTLVAADGGEAVALFEQHLDDVDLVLLDAVMPKLSGREAHELMKKLDPNVKAVFCTGYDPTTVRTRLDAVGEAPILEKPFDEEGLLHAVRAMIESPGSGELPEGRVPVEAGTVGKVRASKETT